MPDLVSTVAAKNKTNIKANKADEVTYPYEFAIVDGQPVVVIGQHPSSSVSAVRKAPGSCHGNLMVKKGGMLSPGEMIVTGFRGDRAAFQRAIADFSKKRAKFV